VRAKKKEGGGTGSPSPAGAPRGGEGEGGRAQDFRRVDATCLPAPGPGRRSNERLRSARRWWGPPSRRLFGLPERPPRRPNPAPPNPGRGCRGPACHRDERWEAGQGVPAARARGMRGKEKGQLHGQETAPFRFARTTPRVGTPWGAVPAPLPAHGAPEGKTHVKLIDRGGEAGAEGAGRAPPSGIPLPLPLAARERTGGGPSWPRLRARVPNLTGARRPALHPHWPTSRGSHL
jgi:hypothetical protein